MILDLENPLEEIKEELDESKEEEEESKQQDLTITISSEEEFQEVAKETSPVLTTTTTITKILSTALEPKQKSTPSTTTTIIAQYTTTTTKDVTDHSYLKASQSFNNFGPSLNKITQQQDDDVIEILYVPQKPTSAKKNIKKETFYDNDSDINENVIKARWNVKSLANPDANLSMTFYRSRLFGDNRPPPKREFKQGLFHLDEDPFDEPEGEVQPPNLKRKSITSESSPVDYELMKRDEAVLNKRIDEISRKHKEGEMDLDVTYGEHKTELDRIYDDTCNEIQVMTCGTNRVRFFNELRLQYDTNLHQLEMEYNNKMEELKRQTQTQIDALRDLFNSGSYEKGNLHAYTTLEVYQPSAKRRKYDDNGYRLMLLPEKLIKNIIQEDELYYHYYGLPKTSTNT